ncbi:hypothetical protein Mtc_1983 [Methanocella conradii HZ254]|uniref:Uncharacterized protein n=1 Tax=Methanocella conradii (strain DSM 24694 / JCM 17849 / CGMCC 1.5162 / HZ254) TaxID=1041930 RepID=H8I676_METCZ|nr:hypothetical protein [Methanocella conradii]AFD00723.1 hypothetical protein Mtc_1983 [Methanocella conradii HZ254]
MWVTVLASQPSESMPTEMTFCIFSPGFPIWPMVSTFLLKSSACSFLVILWVSPVSSVSPLLANSPDSAISSTLESMCRM